MPHKKKPRRTKLCPRCGVNEIRRWGHVCTTCRNILLNAQEKKKSVSESDRQPVYIAKNGKPNLRFKLHVLLDDSPIAMLLREIVT